MNKIEEQIQALGMELPPMQAPKAAYVPVKKVNDLVYVSGQGPVVGIENIYVGKVGEERTIEEGQKAAEICILNALAAIKSVLGSLDNILEVVRVQGYVNCTSDFTRQPEVINGASKLLEKIFDEAGKHTRTAIGTNSLPDNITVELDMIVRAKS